MAGEVGQTFQMKSREKEEAALPDMADAFSLSLTIPGNDRTKKTSKRDVQPEVHVNPKELEMGAWFYDTPGVIYKEQVCE